MTDGYFDRVEEQLAELTRSGAHVRAERSRRVRFSARGRLRSGLAMATSLVVVAAVVAVALRAHPQPATRLSPPATTEGGVSPALTANLNVLRRPEQKRDRDAVGLALGAARCSIRSGRRARANPLMPDTTSGVTPCTTGPTNTGPTALQRRYGLEDPASLPMRHVLLPTAHIETWLIAGSRGACWNAVGPRPGHVIGERCFSSAGVGRRILLGTVAQPHTSGFEIGLVTDTAHALELRRSDGTTKMLPLRDGYFYTTYGPGDRIVADTSNGARVIQTFATDPITRDSRQPR